MMTFFSFSLFLLLQSGSALDVSKSAPSFNVSKSLWQPEPLKVDDEDDVRDVPVPITVTVPTLPAVNRYLQRGDPKFWQELGSGVGSDNLNDLAGHCVASNHEGNIIAISSPKFAKPALVDPNHYVFQEYRPSGRVQVYEYDNGASEWMRLGHDIVGEELDCLGTSLAIDAKGENVVVGMINDILDKIDVGSVRVYTYDENSGGGVWIQKGPSLEGEFSFERFGAAVDISNNGSIVAVGSPMKDVKSSKDTGWEKEVGEVRIYKYEPNTAVWTMMGESITGTHKFGHFGSAVSLSGTGRVVAVGAPHALDYQKGSVSIHEFLLADTNWHSMGSVEGASYGDQFGTSVSLSNDGKAFIAGAPFHNVLFQDHFIKNSGHARAFKLEYDTWLMLGDIVTGEVEGQNFGASVSISNDGKKIAVGSPKFSTNGKNSGYAIVYFLEGNSWRVSGTQVEGKEALDVLGTDVALSGEGDVLIVGAPGGEYAKIFAYSEIAPPTMSPKSTQKGSNGSGSGSWSHATRFWAAAGILGVSTFFVVAIYQTVVYVQRRKDRLDLVPPDDLEMRNEAGVL